MQDQSQPPVPEWLVFFTRAVEKYDAKRERLQRQGALSFADVAALREEFLQEITASPIVPDEVKKGLRTRSALLCAGCGRSIDVIGRANDWHKCGACGEWTCPNCTLMVWVRTKRGHASAPRCPRHTSR